MNRILFIGAHTDDEQWAAGTLSKFKKTHEVYLAIFSFCEKSSEQLGYSKDILEKEFISSTKVLGIENQNIFTSHFPVRHFSEHRQVILDKLIDIRKRVKPNIVITHNLQDRHQDHLVIAEECRRAFPYSTLLGFETFKGPLNVEHKCYVRLKLEHVNMKLACFNCYKSQKVRKNPKRSQIISSMLFRGAQAGCTYAEAFEVIHLYL